MLKFIPIIKNKNNQNKLLLDNVNQVKKILYRFNAHGRFFIKSLRKGASLRNLLISRFPFTFTYAKLPPSMHLELTDACNLKCVYCNNQHFISPRKIMSDEIVESLLKNLKTHKIDRFCLGGGEPTIHPKFINILERIRKEVRVLTIVSNAQWSDDAIPEALIKNNVDLIEISVDAGGKEQYEKSRIGANYDTLKQNLLKLKEYKKKYNSTSQINIRLMVRPSNLNIESKEKKYWKSYCDTIMPQYLMKLEDTPYDEDVFTSKHHVSQEYPKCTLPFKNLQIRATGNIYVCQVSGSTLRNDKKILIGNINKSSISDMWNSQIMNTYRNAHAKRIVKDMPICKGCRGC